MEAAIGLSVEAKSNKDVPPPLPKSSNAKVLGEVVVSGNIASLSSCWRDVIVLDSAINLAFAKNSSSSLLKAAENGLFPVIEVVIVFDIVSSKAGNAMESNAEEAVAAGFSSSEEKAEDDCFVKEDDDFCSCLSCPAPAPAAVAVPEEEDVDGITLASPSSVHRRRCDRLRDEEDVAVVVVVVVDGSVGRRDPRIGRRGVESFLLLLLLSLGETFAVVSWEESSKVEALLLLLRL